MISHDKFHLLSCTAKVCDVITIWYFYPTNCVKINLFENNKSAHTPMHVHYLSRRGNNNLLHLDYHGCGDFHSIIHSDA